MIKISDTILKKEEKNHSVVNQMTRSQIDQVIKKLNKETFINICMYCYAGHTIDPAFRKFITNLNDFQL